MRFQAPRGTLSRSSILLAGLALSAQPAAAVEQPVEPKGPVSLAAWVGYLFTTPVATSSGSITIDAAPSYGAALTVVIDPEFEFELLWTLSSTEAHLLSSAGAPSSGQDHLNINYFQAGLTKSIRCGDFECFGDVTVGAVLLSPGAILLGAGQRLSFHDTWRAAFTLGAGVRFRLADPLAVVLQGRFLAPVYITSGAFYSGKGGSTVVVTAGIPCVEGAFSLGLVLAL